MRIERGQPLRQRPLEFFGGDVEDHAFSGHSLVGFERLLVEGVAEQVEAHATNNLLAPAPEQFLPLIAGEQLRQPGIDRGDDHAGFVEQRQRIAHRTARFAAFARLHFAVVMAVDRRLGLGKGDPHQRIEQIVPVAIARQHLAVGEHALLVGLAGFRLLRHEFQRLAAAAHHFALLAQAVQFGQRGEVVLGQTLDHGRQRREHRRSQQFPAIPDRCSRPSHGEAAYCCSRQARRSPARSGTSSSSPNANAGCTCQLSRRRVIFSRLRGRR